MWIIYWLLGLTCALEPATMDSLVSCALFPLPTYFLICRLVLCLPFTSIHIQTSIYYRCWALLWDFCIHLSAIQSSIIRIGLPIVRLLYMYSSMTFLSSSEHVPHTFPLSRSHCVNQGPFFSKPFHRFICFMFRLADSFHSPPSPHFESRKSSYVLFSQCSVPNDIKQMSLKRWYKSI